MAPDAIRVRPAEDGDRRPLALLFAAVAEERDGIAAEPPVDVDRRAANWDLVEEGRLTQQIRRANGERWDLIEMGLLL